MLLCLFHHLAPYRVRCAVVSPGPSIGSPSTFKQYRQWLVRASRDTWRTLAAGGKPVSARNSLSGPAAAALQARRAGGASSAVTPWLRWQSFLLATNVLAGGAALALALAVVRVSWMPWRRTIAAVVLVTAAVLPRWVLARARRVGLVARMRPLAVADGVAAVLPEGWGLWEAEGVWPGSMSGVVVLRASPLGRRVVLVHRALAIAQPQHLPALVAHEVALARAGGRNVLAWDAAAMALFFGVFFRWFAENAALARSFGFPPGVGAPAGVALVLCSVLWRLPADLVDFVGNALGRARIYQADIAAAAAVGTASYVSALRTVLASLPSHHVTADKGFSVFHYNTPTVEERVVLLLGRERRSKCVFEGGIVPQAATTILTLFRRPRLRSQLL